MDRVFLDTNGPCLLGPKAPNEICTGGKRGGERGGGAKADREKGKAMSKRRTGV